MKQRLLHAVLAAVVITALMAFGWLDTADSMLSDALYQRAGAGSADIVIVGIDQAALDVLGPMPWSRKLMAEAVTFLNHALPEGRPAVIGIDVLYSGSSADPEADRLLAEAAGEYGNVVTATAALFETRLEEGENGVFSARQRAVTGWDRPYNALEQSAGTGHINAMEDADGILRHALLYVEDEEQGRVLSFARVIYEHWCRATGKEINPCPAVSSGGFFYLPFSAAGGGYSDGVSFLDLLDGTVDPLLFRDRIVLIGPYAPGLQDAYPTSLDRASLMYGVDIQANTIEAFQKGFFPREGGKALQLLILFAVSFAAALFLQKQPMRRAAVGALVLCAAWIPVCLLCYRLGLILRPLPVPVSVAVLFLWSAAENYMRIREEKRRIAAELSVAARIQRDMLPDRFPERTEFDLYASMTPAKEVGGDFYDFFQIDEDHFGFVIGDVSGKGVPASLFMTVAMTVIRDHTMQALSPGAVLREVNRVICARNDESMFVTVWLGILELSTGRLVASSAGHEYPILREAGGAFQVYKDRHGLPIGAMDGAKYRDYELNLEPGSAFFVYTDGLPEAINPAKEQFGVERAVETLNTEAADDPQAMVETAHSAVDRFAGREPQFDDLTMLAVIWHGTK